MRILGAIFAGGASRRFGADKARANFRGKPLIEHVVDRLAPQTDDLIICGAEWKHFPNVADRPHADLGPLGALCGALAYAKHKSFDAVLTSGCDLPMLPLDLATSLSGPHPKVAAGEPLLGFWPVAFSARLGAHLERSTELRMLTWIGIAGAESVDFGAIANINFAEDLIALDIASPGE